MYCVTSHDVCKSITYYGIKMLSWAHGRRRVSYLFVCWIAPVTHTHHFRIFFTIIHSLIFFNLVAILGHVVANKEMQPVRIDICPTNC